MLPCCWVASTLYYAKLENYKDAEMWKLINQIGGKEKLNARNGLQSVFDSGILELIKDGWEAGDGRLKICAQTCGTEYSPIDLQTTL